jgi:hypothetical protein
MTGRHLPPEGVEDVHGLLPRDREDVLAALGGETVDEQGGSRPVGRVRHLTTDPAAADASRDEQEDGGEGLGADDRAHGLVPPAADDPPP